MEKQHHASHVLRHATTTLPLSLSRITSRLRPSHHQGHVDIIEAILQRRRLPRFLENTKEKPTVWPLASNCSAQSMCVCVSVSLFVREGQLVQ